MYPLLYPDQFRLEQIFKEQSLEQLKAHGHIDVSDLTLTSGVTSVDMARRLLLDLCVENEHVITYDTCMFLYYDNPPINIRKEISAYFKLPKNKGQMRTVNEIADGIKIRPDIVTQYLFSMMDRDTADQIELIFAYKLRE